MSNPLRASLASIGLCGSVASPSPARPDGRGRPRASGSWSAGEPSRVCGASGPHRGRLEATAALCCRILTKRPDPDRTEPVTWTWTWSPFTESNHSATFSYHLGSDQPADEGTSPKGLSRSPIDLVSVQPLVSHTMWLYVRKAGMVARLCRWQ